MKILQIGHDRLFSKYLTTSKVDAVSSAKMHVSFVCLLSYMRTDCSHSLLRIATLIQYDPVGTALMPEACTASNLSSELRQYN